MYVVHTDIRSRLICLVAYGCCASFMKQDFFTDES